MAHTPEFTVFRGRVEALSALVESRGRELAEETRIFERSGRALFVVYRVVEPLH